jgi:hypothetical protein
MATAYHPQVCRASSTVSGNPAALAANPGTRQLNLIPKEAFEWNLD